MSSVDTSPVELARVDLASRLSFRAIVSGAIFELAVFSALMVLGAGLGVWQFPGILDAEAVRNAGGGVYVWGTASLAIAAFGGGFLASVAGRSPSARDGILHGVVTWATACFSGAILSCVWFMSALKVGLATTDVSTVLMASATMSGFFIADALAFGAALVGGLFGARSEVKEATRARAGALRPERASV